MTKKETVFIANLEEKVRKIIDSDSGITIELDGLSEQSYHLLKHFFEKNYEVMATANINDRRTNADNYVLQIRKR